MDGEHAEYAYEYHGHEVLPPKRDVQMQFSADPDSPVILYSDEWASLYAQVHNLAAMSNRITSVC